MPSAARPYAMATMLVTPSPEPRGATTWMEAANGDRTAPAAPAIAHGRGVIGPPADEAVGPAAGRRRSCGEHPPPCLFCVLILDESDRNVPHRWRCWCSTKGGGHRLPAPGGRTTSPCRRWPSLLLRPGAPVRSCSGSETGRKCDQRPSRSLGTPSISRGCGLSSTAPSGSSGVGTLRGTVP